MSGRDLVSAAFTALGPAASRHEVALVAEVLRASGDPEVLALFGVGPGGPVSEAPFDHEACQAVRGIAVQAGAGPFTGLDLYTEVVRPGWTPFPRQAATPMGARDE